MSQYKDQITGKIEMNLRVLGSGLYDLSGEYDKYNSASSPSFEKIASEKYKAVKMTSSNHSLIILMKNNINLNNKFTYGFWCYLPSSGLVQDNSNFHMPNFLTSFRYYTNKTTYSSDRAIFVTPLGDLNQRYSIQIEKYGEIVDPSYLSAYNLPLNQWNYITVTRNGTNLYGFCNGNLIWTFTSSVDLIVNGFNIYNQKNYICYWNDVVLITGQCLWTSDFTVPNAFLTGNVSRKQTIQKIFGSDWKLRSYWDKAFLY